jgi:hypothetical protein
MESDRVDPISLILGALAAGASSAMAEAASDSIKDAYRALTSAVRKRFASHPRAEVALDGYLEDPDTWRAPLEKALTDTGADGDTELLEAARRLILAVPPADARTYSVDVRDSQGIQIGDHGRQSNVFGASAPPRDLRAE